MIAPLLEVPVLFLDDGDLRYLWTDVFGINVLVAAECPKAIGYIGLEKFLEIGREIFPLTGNLRKVDGWW